MVKHSTLLYRINDYETKPNSENYSVRIDELLNDDFLNTFFGHLVYDPGIDMVKKVIMKATL
ncbi:MAG: hypothetical protein JXR52_00495 [Bacteroidales bacterium]|nr:hypothetical protein [Bacteroidales bacterium]MBN2697273.1 hypothetical protein [Bacteroidales bacterium]